MTTMFVQNGDVIWRLLVAVFLGMVIGTERILVHKEAGMKTHALVSMGSALFIIISELMVQKYFGLSSFDPTRMASQIIVGIGFLGAGSIIFQGSRLTGLTTAVGFWVTAGIGMAAGFGLFGLAVISTVLVLFILAAVHMIEKPIVKISESRTHLDQNN